MIGSRIDRRSGTWLVVAFVAAAASACQNSDVSHGSKQQSLVPCGTTTTTVVSIPTGVDLGDVTLGANGNLFVADRADVLGTIANAGGGVVDLGVEAISGSITSLAPVTLRDRSRVEGDVTSAGSITRQNDVVVTGTLTPFATLGPSNAVSLSATFSDSPAQGVVVPPGGSLSLLPGDYESIVVNANGVLNLSAGTYAVDSLDLEPNSEARLPAGSAAVIVNVRSSIIYRGRLLVPGGGDASLLLLYVGTAPVVLEAGFNGFYVGMGASLQLTGGQSHRGAFFARDVTVTPDVVVEHRDFVPSMFGP